MTIITWNPICNFVLLINCIELLLASNWNPWKTKECNQHLGVQIDPCIHPLKEKKIGIKNLDLWAKNSPWNKKIRIDYMNNANANHIKTIEIKLAWWLAPLFPHKEIWVQISLWLKWWPLKGPIGLIWIWFFCLFFCLLCFQKLYHYIQVSIMKIEQKSDLKNKLQGLNKLEFYFFSHFW